MKELVKSRTAVVLGASALLALSTAGGAVAHGMISSQDIVNQTIQKRDIGPSAVGSGEVVDGSLRMRDLHGNVKEAIRSQGDRGPAGPQGEPGQSLVAQDMTSPNPAYGGINVVDVRSVPAGSGAPAATEGVALWDPIQLEAGTYLVQTTSQFFDFTPSGTVGDYGVGRLFLDGRTVATGWSSDIPNDRNNAGQSSGSFLLTVPSGGGELTGRTVIRGGDANGGQAGANIIVTRLAG